MYKDPDRQREADRARQKRRRDKIKAEGVTESGRDGQGVTQGMTVLNSTVEGITAKGLAQGIPNPERTAQGNIRVSKPGDSDYDGICTEAWRAERGR